TGLTAESGCSSMCREKPLPRISRFREPIRGPISHWKGHHFLEARAMTEETIFATALEKPPDARAAYLSEACGEDEVLRKRLEGLLAASEKVGNFMAHPAVAPAADPDATEALPASADHDAKTTSCDEEPLTFLNPPTRPDSLGRLGHYEVLQV